MRDGAYSEGLGGFAPGRDDPWLKDP